MVGWEHPRVRLVVLNYNGGELVERCVDHLEGARLARRSPRARRRRQRLDRRLGGVGSPPALGCEVRRSPENVGLPGQQPRPARPRRRRLRRPDQQRRLRGARLPASPLVDALLERTRARRGVPEDRPRAPLRRCAHREPAVVGPGRSTVPRRARRAASRWPAASRWRDAHFGDGFHARGAGRRVGRHLPLDGRRRPASGSRSTVGEDARSRPPVGPDAGAPSTVADGRAPRGRCEVGPDRRSGSTSSSALTATTSSTTSARASSRAGYGGDRGFLERDTGQYEAAADVFAWCGAGVLFRPAYLARRRPLR